MPDAANTSIYFAEFEIDRAHRRLLRRSDPVPLNAKAFDLLVYLVENSGRVVSKEQILDNVWDGKVVEESNIAVQMSHLRRALGESRTSARFFMNIPGKGYKFAPCLSGEAGSAESPGASDTVAPLIDKIADDRGRPARSVSKIAWLVAAAVAFVALIAAVAVPSIYRDTSSSAAATPDIIHTKVTASGQVTCAAISADGKFAVLSQKESDGESLWLRQMQTGSQTNIVRPQPVEYLGLTISPDGQFVYASIFSRNETDTPVVRIPIIGGLGEPIPNVTAGVAISFSPDGKRFAFTASNSRERQTLLSVADTDGAKVRHILQAGRDTRYIANFRSSPAAWSPDGKDIALAVTEKLDGVDKATILSVDPDSGTEQYLTGHRWSYVDHLAWLDADRLAFIATEPDGLRDQIWVLSKRTGELRMVTNSLRRYAWLSAAGSTLLTVQIDAVTSLRVGAYDEDAVRPLITHEVFSASEYVDEIDWDSRGGIIYVSTASGTREVWRMKADGSENTRLTASSGVAFGVAASPLDGSIIFAASRNDGRGLFVADANGQAPRRLTVGPDIGPDVADDGTIVFHRGIGSAEGAYIMTPSGDPPRLLRERCVFPAISSDRRLAACYFMDSDQTGKWQIALISTETGATIRTFAPTVPIYERQIRFHPSGKYITQIFSSGEELHLMMLPIDGGQPHIITDLGKGTSNVAQWSPDGARLTYPVMSETRDAVLVRGF